MGSHFARLKKSGLLVLLLVLAGVSPALSGEPPVRAILNDVPFVSWKEAAEYKFSDSDIVNPSISATTAMSFKFFGFDFVPTLNNSPDGLESGSKRNASLEDLYAQLAQGRPVIVSLPLTPKAHPLYPVWAGELSLWNEEKLLEELDRARGRTSGIMLTFAPLPLTRRILDSMEKNGTDRKYYWDSVIQAERLVIGYDKAGGTITFHDPSFGPAQTMKIGDFERQWTLTGRTMLYFFAKTSPKVPALDGKMNYPSATLDQKASQQYVFAYGEAASGNTEKAIAGYSALVKGPATPANIRHLALIELAHIDAVTGNFKRALAELDKAIALEPGDPFPFVIIHAMFSQGKTADARKLAQDAESRRIELCRHPESIAQLVKRLSPNVRIYTQMMACFEREKS